jgi:hypothetical protein
VEEVLEIAAYHRTVTDQLRQPSARRLDGLSLGAR